MAINGASHKMIMAVAAGMSGDQPLEMLMLGDQVLRPKFCKNNGIDHTMARFFYAEMDEFSGVRAIDKKGGDGVLALNLGSAQKKLFDSCDVLFNGGTLEHVKDQKQGWRNAHYFTREGGVMMHVCSLMGLWPNHKAYLYHPDFFVALAEANDYEVLFEDVYEYKGGEVTMIAMRKMLSGPFYWKGCDEFIEDRSK